MALADQLKLDSIESDRISLRRRKATRDLSSMSRRKKVAANPQVSSTPKMISPSQALEANTPISKKERQKLKASHQARRNAGGNNESHQH